MTDHKFTDEEVIKALKYHADEGNRCSECALRDYGCGLKMASLALALINRQKAEIERLQSHLDCYEETSGNKQAKAEAIKEFAERVKAESVGLFSEADIRKTVDDLVKEMTEEKTDEKIH